MTKLIEQNYSGLTASNLRGKKNIYIYIWRWYNRMPKFLYAKPWRTRLGNLPDYSCGLLTPEIRIFTGRNIPRQCIYKAPATRGVRQEKTTKRFIKNL